MPRLPRTAWLELDLDALSGNLSALRELSGPGMAVHPVVKADAYGHGAVPIARALESAGADGFCVAALDEALALRAGGIRRPLLVLYPIPRGWARDAARAGIAVTAGAREMLTGLLGALLDGASGDAGDHPLDIHLEVETGLGRGGLDPEDAAGAAQLILAAPRARLAGLWTHMQAWEDPSRTDDQLARFEVAATSLRDAGVSLPGRHVAASGGLLGDGPAGDVLATYDATRPGLAVYGIVPDELGPGSVPAAVASRFRPVMSLHARPVRVADLPAGWGISYGPTFTTARPSRIATLPLGYGDGWSRSLSNRAQALVRGQRAPIVGNVAMDAVMVDVTDVPGRPVELDDEFVLLGVQGEASIGVLELAHLRNTNTWEVVTSMAARLPRVYHAASVPVALRTLVERGG
ncbi:MAG: alanine racemase [Chloroflexota bacterium]